MSVEYVVTYSKGWVYQNSNVTIPEEVLEALLTALLKADCTIEKVTRLM